MSQEVQNAVEEVPKAPPSQRFHMLYKLGEGTAGRHYIALNRDTGTKVVIRRYPHTEEEGICRCCQREVSALRLLTPTGTVVALYEVIPGDTKTTLVLERCHSSMVQLLNDLEVPVPLRNVPGWDDRSTASRVSLALVRHIVRGLLSALATAHGAGIVHRDVKPAWILFAEDGAFKLSRFDASCPAMRPQDGSVPATCDDDRNDGSPDPSGGHEHTTLWYRSPEALVSPRPPHTALPAGDVWAAGCVLFHLVTGYPPFRGVNVGTQLDIVLAALGSPEADGDGGSAAPTDPLVAQLAARCGEPTAVHEWDRFVTRHSLDGKLPLDGLCLLRSLLAVDHRARPTAAAALLHPFLRD